MPTDIEKTSAFINLLRAASQGRNMADGYGFLGAEELRKLSTSDFAYNPLEYRDPGFDVIKHFATKRAFTSLLNAEIDWETVKTEAAKLVEEIEEIRAAREQGELSEAEALEERIASLIEDQRKYKDLRKLRDLGSDGVDEVIHGSCPTCHQDISDSLMDLGQRSVTMSVDQNIAFYDEQLQLSRAVLENARKSIAASEAEVVGIRSELDRLRSEVRSLRETLTATSITPSIEALAERLRLDQRIERLEELNVFFKEMMAAFANLADDWETLQQRIKRLPKGALSREDDAKLQALQNTLQLQLRSYGFRSVGSELVTVSRDYYEPELSDMKLAADAAASDVIRLQWAYLIGLLEISRQFGGNHLSLLIMDEPQQQSVEDKDFFQMLHHMAEMKTMQIIVGTSHDAAGVATFTAANKSVHLWELGNDHLINPIK